jgi:hypothetical protein
MLWPLEMKMLLRLLGFTLLCGWVAAEPMAPTQISAAGTHLETNAGETFIWIGDTAWELFHKLDREEAIEYLDDRASKGFTVIQAVVLAELDGVRSPNAYGHLPLIDQDPARPNEAYFEQVDFIVEAAAERGLVVGMLPTWGDKLPSANPGAGPLIFSPENAAAFGTFLGHRYVDQPIIWILGGDRNPDVGNAAEIWEAMAGAIKQATDGQHLMTYHPRGWSTSARFFHASTWLDFNMFQSGHETGVRPMDLLSAETGAMQPTKPFVNGEPAYEDIAIRFWDYLDFSQPGPQRVPAGVLDSRGLITRSEHFASGFVQADDVRRQAYLTFLLGAAGYTYGNNAIWQMFKIDGEIALPTLTDWRAALDRPGAQSMRHIRALWESRPLGLLRPAPDALHTAPETQSGYPPLVGTASDGSYLIASLPHGGEIEIKGHVFDQTPSQAWWFNPRDGSAQQAQIYRRADADLIHAKAPSRGDDWVLVIDAPDAGYGPPGQAE